LLQYPERTGSKNSRLADQRPAQTAEAEIISPVFHEGQDR